MLTADIRHETDDVCPSTWEKLPKYDRTSPRTDSDAAIATAVDWIDWCKRGDHGFCDDGSERELPSRVIDVGSNAGPGDVRLVETRGERARYIALSHCWGKQQIITTTKASMTDRLAGIPFDQLSKTFQDAILVTRRLGIRFIWIDSLCIVQDDLGDWEVEASKMMSVYSNAYLTIAATHSPNGAGGLFRDTPDYEVEGSTPSGERYHVFFRRKIDHHLEAGSDSSANDTRQIRLWDYPTIDEHPLLTRAWVYQERMLSQRVLHFGPYELFYECGSDIVCECSGILYYGSSTSIAATATKLVHTEALNAEVVGGELHVYGRYYMAQLWRTMVASYTVLGLTVPTDRLPAMGGLARHMALRRKSKYLAGLWENSLNDDLIWSCPDLRSMKKPRPTPSSAPTWSWASVVTNVWYFDEIIYWEDDGSDNGDFGKSFPTEADRDPYEHFARVEECWTKPAGADEYGTVAESRLRLTGLVAEGVLEKGDNTDEGRERAASNVVFADGLRLPMRADYLLDEAGPNHVPHGTKVWCMRMSQIQSGKSDHLFSIVLGQAGAGQGLFERIGCLNVSCSPPPVDTVGPVYALAEEMTLVIV